MQEIKITKDVAKGKSFAVTRKIKKITKRKKLI
jgi:hypothetical protein